MPFNPVDQRTYLIVEGDTWRYRDLVAEGQPFDSAVAIPLMATGVDDSAWLTGPQPFVDGAATTGTYTQFGDFGGATVTPTVVQIQDASINEGFFVAARHTFTAPAGARRLIARAQFGININIYLDGVFVEQFTGVGYDGAFLGTLSPGPHLLSFYAMGQAFHSSDVAAVMLSYPGGPVAPRLRQFPRDDALGGSPRQGKANGPTSVQASARQGWRGTYR